jgi:hypothetical protein
MITDLTFVVNDYAGGGWRYAESSRYSRWTNPAQAPECGTFLALGAALETTLVAGQKMD